MKLFKFAKINPKIKLNSGFTIIELLIVIAIIGILATMIIAGVEHMQTKSRDTRRIEDMNQISKALELYHVSYFKFPKSTDEIVLIGTDDVSTALIEEGTISSISKDPLYPDYTYRYQTNSIGTSYTLRFCLETESIHGYHANCDNEMTP